MSDEPAPFYLPDELRLIHDAEGLDLRYGSVCWSAVERPGEGEQDRDRMRELAIEVRNLVRRNAERRQITQDGRDRDYQRPYL